MICTDPKNCVDPLGRCRHTEATEIQSMEDDEPGFLCAHCGLILPADSTPAKGWYVVDNTPQEDSSG